MLLLLSFVEITATSKATLQFLPRKDLSLIPNERYIFVSPFKANHFVMPSPFVFEDAKLLELELNSIENLVYKSSFIFPKRETIILSAIKSFVEQLKLGQSQGISNNNYYDIVCILLPQLEHCIRNQYVLINQLPKERLKGSTFCFPIIKIFLNFKMGIHKK